MVVLHTDAPFRACHSASELSAQSTRLSPAVPVVHQSRSQLPRLVIEILQRGTGQQTRGVESVVAACPVTVTPLVALRNSFALLATGLEDDLPSPPTPCQSQRKGWAIARSRTRCAVARGMRVNMSNTPRRTSSRLTPHARSVDGQRQCRPARRLQGPTGARECDANGGNALPFRAGARASARDALMC